MPEFIYGCYNAETKELVKNPRYYENLSKEANVLLSEKIKLQYISIIEERYGLKHYQEMLTDLPEWQFPLNEEDVIKYSHPKEEVQNDFSSLV